MHRRYQRRSGFARRLIRAVTGLLAVLAAAWVAGFVTFATTLPATGSPATGSTDGRTDAIVVLTGGSARISTGFELLAAGLANKLFVSGVAEGIDGTALAGVADADTDQLDCCVALGYDAADTAGNASETADWMQDQGYSSLRLVTADYHMRRSMLEFSHAMPAIAITPHAVAPTTVDPHAWWHDIDAGWLVATEYTKYLVAHARAAAPSWGS